MLPEHVTGEGPNFIFQGLQASRNAMLGVVFVTKGSASLGIKFSGLVVNDQAV